MKTQLQHFNDSDGRRISITVKRQAVNLFVQPPNNLWTFDREGRLISMFINGNYYRRTLDNRLLHKYREKVDGVTLRRTRFLPEAEARDLIQPGHRILQKLEGRVSRGIRPVLDKILKMDSSARQREAEQFKTVYYPVSILPPDQYLSLVIQVTEGCNYNQCLFCDFYKDRPFRIKSEAELNQHLHRVEEFFKAGLSYRKGIFLADANALVTPMNRLVPMIKAIRRQFPEHRKIYSFIDIFTGDRKTTADFKALNALGLQRIYLGIESGSQKLLQFLHKEQSLERIPALAERLKAAGVQLGVIFLAGAGGARFHAEHREASLELIRKLPLGKGDIVYISELRQAPEPYRQALHQHRIPTPDDTELKQMTAELKISFKAAVPKAVKVSVYDIQQFVY
ncbi:MAG: radical SAM protein [Fidelibacterota bacterium]